MRKRLVFRLITLLLISLLFSSSIMIVSVLACRKRPKPKDRECCEEKGPIIESLLELSSEISDLPKEAFDNPCRACCQRKVLCIKVWVVIQQVKVGAYQGALNKLKNDIKEKIERWIVDPWKSILVEKVDYIINLLEEFLCRDRKPPTIVTVLRYPETPNYDESVTILAWVVDFDHFDHFDDFDDDHDYRQCGVKSVVLTYSVDQTSWVNVTMESVDGLYIAKIPPQPYNTTVNYKVYAWDEAGNLATSETYCYVVVDSYPPAISYVDRNPASPNYNQNVTVFANVTEPPEASGVKNVTLWYRTDEEWQPVEMTLDQLYTGIIPAFPYETVVQYRVRAFDYADNSASSGVYSYMVGTPPNLPPLAEFIESAEAVLTGVMINFNASKSYDQDGYIASYFWDFGDGTDATSVTADHAYADNGVYTVTLRVTDNDGATATATSTKIVLNRPPVASFTENATIVFTGEVVSFDASGSYDPDGSIIRYVWNFGDGTSASDVKVTHAYADNGVYTATLTVTDDDEATDSSVTVKLVWNRAPVALFTENATVVEKGEAIRFDASGSYDLDGYIVSYLWEFGDGTGATGVTVDHAYAEDGNYTVTLTVTDDDGASSSVSATEAVETPVEWPLALVAAIGLGIAVLTATLLYALYRRRKKKASSSGGGSAVAGPGRMLVGSDRVAGLLVARHLIF